MDESIVKHLEQPAILDKASRLLLASADMIEEKGWWHMGKSGALGSVCAYLAISRSAGSEDHLAAARRLWTSLGGKDANDIIAWNDSPGRTQEEVVSTMRRVALGC